MKEIKYQIVIRNKVYPVTELIWDNQGLWVNSSEGQVIVNENNVLRQFTGLKDKNGKEIYEGDILKNDYGDIFEATIRLMFEENKTKVIGNIYENPNLL